MVAQFQLLKVLASPKMSTISSFTRVCKKPNIGRTVQYTHMRMDGHRGCYYKVLPMNNDVDTANDDYSVGLHLVNEHHCTSKEDFDKLFSVQILEICSPSTVEKKEHRFNACLRKFLLFSSAVICHNSTL